MEKCSYSAKVASEIPQGNVWGQILFLIYINDLPEVITGCMKLFTDDAKLFRRVNSLVQALTVQISLDNAVDWAQTTISIKFKHLHLGDHDINFEYTMQK